jgi:hypothetical protein
MALIGAYDNEPDRSRTSAPSWQKYLAHLETLIDGEPGRPRVTPEPFEPVEASELVDGPVVAPAPPKPPRRPKRRPVPEALPTTDRDLKLLARKLTGRD